MVLNLMNLKKDKIDEENVISGGSGNMNEFQLCKTFKLVYCVAGPGGDDDDDDDNK